jgi:hypothetical protein
VTTISSSIPVEAVDFDVAAIAPEAITAHTAPANTVRGNLFILTVAPLIFGSIVYG